MNIKKKKQQQQQQQQQLWSIETQNIAKEVSVTQTPHLYSVAILILQIWHKKRGNI